MISYQLVRDANTGGLHPLARDVVWPDAVQRRYVWSGRSASTPQFLARLQAWRATHESDYAALMRQLTETAEAATAALARGEGVALVEAAAVYAAGLRELGEASGVSIYSDEHRQIAALAANAGVVYKPCGAGGGDVGVVLALEDPERLEALHLSLRKVGFDYIPLAVDETGLRLEFTEIDEA